MEPGSESSQHQKRKPVTHGLEDQKRGGRVEEILYSEDCKTLAQIVQRAGGCIILGDIQDQAGCGSGQPHLVEDVRAHCRGVGLDEL